MDEKTSRQDSRKKWQQKIKDVHSACKRKRIATAAQPKTSPACAKAQKVACKQYIVLIRDVANPKELLVHKEAFETTFEALVYATIQAFELVKEDKSFR